MTQARDYMQSIIDQSATVTVGLGAETACVTPIQARPSALDANADNATAEAELRDSPEEDADLVLDLSAVTTPGQGGRRGAGRGGGARKSQKRSASAASVGTTVVPGLTDGPPSTPTKPLLKRRNVNTVATDAVHSAAKTLPSTEEVVREQRFSALECRVEWQHKRIYDLTCQVRELEAAVAGAGEAPVHSAANAGGSIAAAALPC